MENLTALSFALRQDVLDMIYMAKTGHIGGDFSVMDILITLYYKQMNVSPEQVADPDRDRRLLMHRREIVRLGAKVQQEGLALVPLSLYFKDSLVKVELGLCKGKKLYDKRSDAAEKSARREMDRKFKEANA